MSKTSILLKSLHDLLKCQAEVFQKHMKLIKSEIGPIKDTTAKCKTPAGKSLVRKSPTFTTFSYVSQFHYPLKPGTTKNNPKLRNLCSSKITKPIKIPIKTGCANKCTKNLENECGSKVGGLTFLPKKKPGQVQKTPNTKNVHSSAVSMSFDDNGVVIKMELKEYKPEEVSIRVEGQWLIIEAIKDTWSKEHNGLIHRHWLRKYELSPEADISRISSSMEKGELVINVPYNVKNSNNDKIGMKGDKE